MARYLKGSQVSWNWSGGAGSGKISNVFTDRVYRTTKVGEDARGVSPECPAFRVTQKDGAEILNSSCERDAAWQKPAPDAKDPADAKAGGGCARRRWNAHAICRSLRVRQSSKHPGGFFVER